MGKLLMVLVVIVLVATPMMFLTGRIPYYSPLYQEGDLIVLRITSEGREWGRVTNLRWIGQDNSPYGTWKYSVTPIE